MTSLRIGVDIRPLLHPASGIGRYTQALLEQLVNSDHQWFLYCDRVYNGQLANRENVTIRSSSRTGASMLNLWASQVSFSRWAKQDQLDVFWSPRHHLPMFLPAKIKTVVTVHDLVWRRFPETMETKNRLLEAALMPPSLKRADKLIAVSTFTAGELTALYPYYAEKTSVVYEAAFEYGDNKDQSGGLAAIDTAKLPKQYFLYVGTNEPRKNLEVLLTSYSQLIDGGASIGLVLVAGAGWGQQSVADQLQGFALQNKVLHFDGIDDAQLDQLYRRAHALLLPSQYEGFGLPVLESMARGVPVIVSNRGSLPEITGDAGLVVDIEDQGTLTMAMQRMATDASLHDDLATKSLLRVKQFSWLKAAAETLVILQSVVSESASRHSGAGRNPEH